MNEKDPSKDIFDNIPMLKNSLLTEDGFLNEACMNELSSLIKNMPETWERLVNEPEWNTPHITNYRDITGALAKWLVRQYNESDDIPPPPPFSPNLESIIGYLTICIRPPFDKLGYAHLSLCQINKMCWDILGDLKIFQDLNTKECLGEHWLDLSALLHNVCVDIRDERRTSDVFDKEFEEKYETKMC